MPLTPEQRIARHKDFLKANWELIAAFAWEHHAQQGPGAVLVRSGTGRETDGELLRIEMGGD